MGSKNKFDANSWDSIYDESTKKIKYEDEVEAEVEVEETKTVFEVEEVEEEKVIPANDVVFNSKPEEKKTVKADDGKKKKITKIILISVLSGVLLAGIIFAVRYLLPYFYSEPVGGYDGMYQDDSDMQNSEADNDSSDSSEEGSETDTTDANSEDNENSEDEEPVSEEEASSDSVSDVLLEDTHVYLNNVIWSASRESYNLVSGVEFVEGGEPDFGDGTSILNRIIKTVDKNASLDTVLMGNFGEEYLEYSVVNGNYHNDKAKYALRTATLTENDIKYEERDEECCVVILKDCTNPKKDYDNPLHRVTDNFVTEEEIIDYYAVNYGVTVSSARLKYHNIIVQIESVDDERVISIAYEVSMTIKFNVSGMTITGSCELYCGTAYMVY